MSVPKFIKFNYKNKELLWLKVEKCATGYYYGYTDNKPITIKILKYKDYLKVNTITVIATKWRAGGRVVRRLCLCRFECYGCGVPAYSDMFHDCFLCNDCWLCYMPF